MFANISPVVYTRLISFETTKYFIGRLTVVLLTYIIIKIPCHVLDFISRAPKLMVLFLFILYGL